MKATSTKQLRDLKSDLAARLLVLRETQGLTQAQLGKAARVDRKTINRIENDWFAPSLETLLRLCKVLQTSPSKVLKGIEV